MALESLPKIAPALFSAEQDLIQIYNKKSDTTGVINPSYIKSSPSGVAGAIQFSDGSAFASSSNLTWNNATNALGLGSGTTSAFIDFASNPAGSTSIVGAIRTYVDGVNLSEVMAFMENGNAIANYLGIAGGANAYLSTLHLGGSNIFQVGNPVATNQYMVIDSVRGSQRGIKFGNQGALSMALIQNDYDLQIGDFVSTFSPSVTFKYNSGNTGFGETNPTAKLQIKGSGSTSATTSLLVQNSSGTTSLQVTDDRTTFVNGLLNVGTIYSGIECNNLYSAIFQNGGSGGQIRLSMGGTNYLQVNQPKDANSGVISGTINTIITPIGYGWSSGTASPNLLSLNPSINNTGTYSGTFRGIYYNPTLTSLTGTTHIAFENTTGDVLFGTTSGNVGIGTNAPTAKMHIVGENSSTSSYAVKVLNSLGGGSLSVTNDGVVQIGDISTQGYGSFLAFLRPSGSTRATIFSQTNTNLTITNIEGNVTYQNTPVKIVGTGSTSATNSLIIQNSSGIQIMKVPDSTSQRVEFGVDITAGTFFGQVYIPGKLFLKSSGEAVFGDDSLNSSAVLQANSTTRGFLPPRMTDAQVRAIVAPAVGLMAYNTDLDCPVFYSAAGWRKVSHSVM